MAVVDIVIIAVYMTLIFLVGAYFYQWIETPDDFYVAGRKLTPFILAAALTATNVNVYSFIGQSGAAYDQGISIIWHTWTGNMALVLSGLFVVPIFRRLRIRTVAEFVGMRYTQGFRGLVGFIWIFRLAWWLSVGIYATAVAAQTFTGITSFTFWVVTLVVITVVYTLLGGLWSVTLTDTLQFILMLGGALILLPLAMQAVGGFSGLQAELPADRLALVPQQGEFNWVFLIAMMLLSIKWATVDQGVLQRAFGGDQVKTSSKGMVFAGIVTTPFAFLWIFPGLAAAVLYQNLGNFDAAVPKLIIDYFPSVLLGLMGCGLLSAMMSTIDSNLHAIATLFTSDIYDGLMGKTPSDRVALTIARGTIVVIGGIIVAFALIVRQWGEGAVEANLTVVGILDMPLFVVGIVYGLLWKRTNWQGALGGYAAGVAAGLAVYFLGAGNFSMATLASTGTALVTCPLFTLLTGEQAPERTAPIWRAKEPVNTGDESEPYHIVPQSAIGRGCIGTILGGFVLYFVGALSGSVAFALASEVAVAGMLLVFAGGLVRLFVD